MLDRMIRQNFGPFTQEVELSHGRTLKLVIRPYDRIELHFEQEGYEPVVSICEWNDHEWSRPAPPWPEFYDFPRMFGTLTSGDAMNKNGHKIEVHESVYGVSGVTYDGTFYSVDWPNLPQELWDMMQKIRRL